MFFMCILILNKDFVSVQSIREARLTVLCPTEHGLETSWTQKSSLCWFVASSGVSPSQTEWNRKWAKSLCAYGNLLLVFCRFFSTWSGIRIAIIISEDTGKNCDFYDFTFRMPMSIVFLYIAAIVIANRSPIIIEFGIQVYRCPQTRPWEKNIMWQALLFNPSDKGLCGKIHNRGSRGCLLRLKSHFHEKLIDILGITFVSIAY